MVLKHRGVRILSTPLRTLLPAQVAEEFQKPAVLWSMPSEIMELLQPKAARSAGFDVENGA